MLSKLVVSIFRFFLRIGIFKDISFLFVASADFGSGSRCYDRGDYRNAFNVLSKYEYSKSDHQLVTVVLGEIQYYLAIMYYYGQGVTRNKERADEIFELSASHGNEKAQKYSLTSNINYRKDNSDYSDKGR